MIEFVGLGSRKLMEITREYVDAPWLGGGIDAVGVAKEDRIVSVKLLENSCVFVMEGSGEKGGRTYEGWHELKFFVSGEELGGEWEYVESVWIGKVRKWCHGYRRYVLNAGMKEKVDGKK